MAGNNYLPTEYQTFIHASRYARWLPDEGRRETWSETVGRLVSYFKNQIDTNYKGVIKNIGLMDEQYKNAWEHVDHSYQIVKAGLLPAYWWWPDVANSYDYLGEQACSEESSSIRWEGDNDKTPKKDWEENIQVGAQHFYNKNNFPPGGVPDTDSEGIKQKIDFIQRTYSRQYESVRS